MLVTINVIISDSQNVFGYLLPLTISTYAPGPRLHNLKFGKDRSFGPSDVFTISRNNFPTYGIVLNAKRLITVTIEAPGSLLIRNSVEK